jgi:hypothetical protein
VDIPRNGNLVEEEDYGKQWVIAAKQLHTEFAFLPCFRLVAEEREGATVLIIKRSHAVAVEGSQILQIQKMMAWPPDRCTVAALGWLMAHGVAILDSF